MNVGGASARRPLTSYEDAIAWLFGTQRFGIKLGLENIQRLLAALGISAPGERIIHVAGTNGKGSVCAMIDAIARAQGYRSGLFTSPHLVTFRERIKVNGEMISPSAVAAGLMMIRALIHDWNPHPTFFEITTALGLLHFRSEGCELIALETGLGGRLDATNAVTPIVSVLTPIDYDHQKWLGHSLAEIAAEKAGIIKRQVPVVSAIQPREAETVIRHRAAECEAPLEFVSQQYDSSPLALHGMHQKQNAAVAIAALRTGRIAVDEGAVEEGLATVTWPARFQRWNDRIVIDGAHNPAGARLAAAAWREEFGDEKAALVFGILRDKDAAAVYRELAKVAGSVVLPSFRGERVMLPAELAEIVASVTPRIRYQIAPSCADALRIAQESSRRVLVAGSLHLAGEVLALLRGTAAAFEECAQ